MLKSRAKHLRESTQKNVIELRKIEPLLKPYLDSTMLIFKEFTEIGVPADDCHDWLYERYSEVRKLIKAALKPANISSRGKSKKDIRTSTDALAQCFDSLQTIDQLVQNSVLNFRSAAQPHQIIDLCVGDILCKYLQTKVSLCVDQLIAILKADK